MEQILQESKKLPLILPEVVNEYFQHKQKMVEFVDSQMDNVANIDLIIGRNPRSIMYDNHKYHAMFMFNIFKFNQFELLAQTIPWVYDSYHSHGFSYEYFVLELESWKAAISKFLKDPGKRDILAVYDWMLKKHLQIIRLAVQENLYNPLKNEEISAETKKLTQMLIEGDIASAYVYAHELINSMGLKDLYLKVFQQSLYYIGQLWESGEISIAQEHMASALIMRVMNTLQFRVQKQLGKGKVIVTSSPNELHEIGARMVADFLELDGWTVYYLGANVPLEALVSMIEKFKPDLLAISLTMPFNIDKASEIILTIKNKPEFANLKIIIGGQIINAMPGLRSCLKVDGFAKDASEAVSLANKLKNKD